MQLSVPRLFTVRAMVFACVLLLAFVLVFPTLSSYLRQKAEVGALRAQVVAAQQHDDDLQADLDRWKDPAYVTAQARERLSFVLPGEKAFRVVDPETVPDTAPVEKGPAAALDTGGTQPWYASVWDSVQVAGASPVPATQDAPKVAPTPVAPSPGDNGSPTPAPGG